MDKNLFKGHSSLAEMVSTHIENWRTCLEMVASFDEEPSYYQHELKALADIEAAVKAIKDAPKELSSFEKLRELMGYVENGSDVRVQITQDDATRTYHVSAWNMDGKLWSEWDKCLDTAINKAYEKFAE